MSSEATTEFGSNDFSDALGADRMTVALIGPDERTRQLLAHALSEVQHADVREFRSYPSGFDNFQWLMSQAYDVVILDLDTDQEVASDLVQRISAAGTSSVMVYSERADQRLAVQVMRAGAREYILLPLEREGVVAEALANLPSTPRAKAAPLETAAGNLFLFLGAKGGCGVTTATCNMAVALARSSEKKTLLVDLNLPMGDAALTLGLSEEFTTEDAFRNVDRLDANLLQKLLIKHSSGLMVLAAPSKISEVEPTKDAIEKLIRVTRSGFDNVIVDMGSRIHAGVVEVLKRASTVYLVTQTGIAELRNSHRLITQYFGQAIPRLEVVVNRFEPRLLEGINEEVITKALGRPISWKIPDDEEAKQEMERGATGNSDTRIARVCLEMASVITGQPVPQKKKKGFGLKNLNRIISDDAPGGSEPPSLSITPRVTRQSRVHTRRAPSIKWPTPASIRSGEPLSATQLNASSSVQGTFEYNPGLGEVLPAGTHTLSVVFMPADSDKHAIAQASVQLEVGIATPVITWTKPDPIPYGTAIGSAQLNASSTAPGTFTYAPPEGEKLAAGTHLLSVLFSPADAESYATVEAHVQIDVTKLVPSIQWAAPQMIREGTPLSATELCATTPVLGSFEFSPARGEMLPAGTHILTATFTPADDTNYAAAVASVSISVVAKGIPVIQWPTPVPIPYGTALSSKQLCAQTSVPGTFTYMPPIGEALAAGTHELSVVFTPKETGNYVTIDATVALEVVKATPVIEWPAPQPMRDGMPLSTMQLCASASVQGSFEYSPALDEKLSPGKHTLKAVFTPSDADNYASAQATVSLIIEARKVPVVSWPEPASITFGVPLSAEQLCATASIAGEFVYSPTFDEILSTGRHALSVSFTPADVENYSPVQMAVELEVSLVVPSINWNNLVPISYGSPLGDAELCATASVPGTFRYSPAAGKILPAGIHTLAVTFEPEDRENYGTAEVTVSIEVAKSVPYLEWHDPEPLECGTPLGAAQLCAKASVPGSFEYSPSDGETLAAGIYALSVIFQPEDSTNYERAQTITMLEVVKATPAITWAKPEPITFGTLLSEAQLGATAPVPGSFEYSHQPGEKFSAGTHTLSVKFSPADTVNYAVSEATIQLEVNKAIPTVNWKAPGPIEYGSELSAVQLCAVASVAGDFDYLPANGEILSAGTHYLSAIFTPIESENYATAQTTVAIEVTKVKPATEWATPDRITYGTPLGAAQLCATASVPGTFEYSPSTGAILTAGTHTLSVTFHPNDSVDYGTAQATVILEVAKAAPVLHWNVPASIECGTRLSAAQLCATASVPGTFQYSPSAGEMLDAGAHKLVAIFAPEDSANYEAAGTTTSLEVVKSTPAIIWPQPGPIAYGTLLSAEQFCASVAVPGTLSYSHKPGEKLSAGRHALTVNFAPADTANFSANQAAVQLEVTKALPLIEWRAPNPIEHGLPLTDLELSATSPVPGEFRYSPAHGETLTAGTHTLSVTFTPTDSENYSVAQAKVPLNVTKGTIIVSWTNPVPITYGTRLSKVHLSATASAEGTLDYSPSIGEILPAGTHTLTVTVTPADSDSYGATKATVPIEVVKATPVVDWPTPKGIRCDSLLGNKQLCATASVPGTYEYSPAAGEALTAGLHELAVVFTPKDTANYTTAEATVSIEVAKVTPSVDWPTPRAITSGTPLGMSQLNAEAWVPGSFIYTPTAGEVLPVGRHTLSVTFTPTDRSSYTAVQSTVVLTVIEKPKPTISWAKPQPIPYGTSLSADQLCATSAIPGKFTYSPAAGEVLVPGVHELRVSFTPAESEEFDKVEASVSLAVNKVTPATTWLNPDPIEYGTALGRRQLCATASIPGIFEYSPEPGRVLPVGEHALSATFKPSEGSLYATARASARLRVTKATPAIEWSTPKPIRSGTLLTSAQLCATCAVPGTYYYSRSLGDQLPDGMHTLSVSFTPADPDQYEMANAAVELEVRRKVPWAAILGTAGAALVLLLLLLLMPLFNGGKKPAPEVPVQAAPAPVPAQPVVDTSKPVHKAKPPASTAPAKPAPVDHSNEPTSLPPVPEN